MKKSYSTLAIAALTLCTATAGYADLERGKRLFNQSCAMCHGKQGEKSALDQSALLNTLKTDEIITAFQARKAGEIVGAGNAAKSRLSEEDMKSLAEYIETLK